MKDKRIILVILLIGVISGFIYLNSRLEGQISQQNSKQVTTGQSPCVPTFVDGGGPYYLPNVPFRTILAPQQNAGTKLIVSGRILRSDCETVVPNAILDIWHADPQGNYKNDWYRGKVKANEKGEFLFETLVPKGYGEGTGYRPPHIHFKVFINDQEIITSQMFFPDVKGRFEDAYIMDVTTKEENGKIVQYATHDIILP